MPLRQRQRHMCMILNPAWPASLRPSVIIMHVNSGHATLKCGCSTAAMASPGMGMEGGHERGMAPLRRRDCGHASLSLRMAVTAMRAGALSLSIELGFGQAWGLMLIGGRRHAAPPGGGCQAWDARSRCQALSRIPPAAVSADQPPALCSDHPKHPVSQPGDPSSLFAPRQAPAPSRRTKAPCQRARWAGGGQQLAGRALSGEWRPRSRASGAPRPSHP